MSLDTTVSSSTKLRLQNYVLQTNKETTMKQMILAVVLLASLGGAQAHAVHTAVAADPQVKDDLFAGTEKFAKNAVSATEVTMDPEMLGLVDGKDKDKAKGMKLNVVRTYTYDKPGQYDMADVEAIRAKLMTGDWHCSVHSLDLKRGTSTDICRKTRTDDLVESAIMTVEPKQLTFIHTIRAKGSYGGSYGGGWYNDQSSLTMGPSTQVEMAVMGAEMPAEMAALRPELLAMRPELLGLGAQVRVDGLDLSGLTVDLDGLKDLKLPRLRTWKDVPPKAAEPVKP
jgi:hypothetical protein